MIYRSKLRCTASNVAASFFIVARYGHAAGIFFTPHAHVELDVRT